MSVLMYLLKVILCSGILFGYYYLFLRNKRFHHYNRFYLLAALALSMVLPLIRIQVLEEDGMLQQVAYRSVKVVTLQETAAPVGAQPAASTPPLFTLANLLWLVYGVGVLYLLVALVRSLRYIKKLSGKYPYEMIEQLKLYQTNEPGTPFSFFRSIYWNEELNFNSVKGQQIFRHELFHVQQRHSADTIAAELITMSGWFNPFFYLIKRELKAIHEFLADQYAASGSNRYQYAELLVQQVMESRSPQITHPFFQNQLKRRIAMIMQHNQSKYGYWSRVMVLPISVFLFFSVSLYAQERKAEKQAADLASMGQVSKNASPDTIRQLAANEDATSHQPQGLPEPTKQFSFPATSPLVTQRWRIIAADTVVPGRKVVTGQYAPRLDAAQFKNFDLVFDKTVLYTDTIEDRYFTAVDDKIMRYADTVKSSHFTTVKDAWMLYTDSTMALYQGDQHVRYTDSTKVLYFKAVKDTEKKPTQGQKVQDTYRWQSGIADTTVPKLQRHFNKNYRYPVTLLENHGEGSIYYSFLLDEDGTLKDFEVYDAAPTAAKGKIYEIVIVGYANKAATKTLSASEKHELMKGEVDRVAARQGPIPGKFKPTRYYFKATWKAQVENAASKPTTSRASDVEKTYVKVDILPAYTGGANAWKSYLSTHLQYPAKAVSSKVEGTVVVQFVVKKEGGIDQVQSISGPDELKAEASRLVLNSAANWKPAVQDGQPVRAYMKQPIIFKL